MGFKENTNGRPLVYWKFLAERISKAKCFKASTKGLILNTVQKYSPTSITQLKFRILT